MAQAQVDLWKQSVAEKSDVHDIVDSIIKRINSTYTIKHKQMEAITNILSGFDTLAILPTSYGKSMIYQMLPQVFRQIKNHENPVLVVISPLKSLIKDQIAEIDELQSFLGIKACSLDDDLSIEKIKSKNYAW